MILIADSGGSKLDWRIIQTDGRINQASGSGFNPYYQDADDLSKSIEGHLLEKVDGTPTQVFYYGTGVSSEKNQARVKDVLMKYFDSAAIEVSHDLLGAARGLCGSEPGIACILGTGANSCLYDGEKITQNAMSLGWILGDEGSGSHMGKRIAVDFLRSDLPQELSLQFAKRFPSSREDILRNVYQEERPAAYFGSFSKFIFQHLKEPYCYNLVYSGFKEFFGQNVLKYEGYEKLKIHFSGSIAFYFSDVLRQVANDLGVTVRNILESPIAGLTLYHQPKQSS